MPERLQPPQASSSTPRALNVQSGNAGEVSRRRQPKSRNGCITCKGRRMKCDETKPACHQCARRGITCGGYPKFLRWRPITQDKEHTEGGDGHSPNDTSKDEGRSTKALQSEVPVQELLDQVRLDQPLVSSVEEMAKAGTSSTNQVLIGPPFNKSPLTTPQRDRGDQAGTDFDVETFFHDNPAASFDPQLSNTASRPVPEIDDLIVETDDTVLMDQECQDWNLLLGQHAHGFPQSVLEKGIDESIWHFPELSLNADAFAEPQSPFLTSPGRPPENIPPAFYPQPQSPSAIPKMMKYFFESHTGGILSIHTDPEGRNENQWRTFVWPQASDYPALHDALAAMACLSLCKTQPHLRPAGLQYAQNSTRALEDTEMNGTLPLTIAIAARLALGFAEQWDCQQPSTGIDHINYAKILIRQAVSNLSSLVSDDLKILSFLADTCLYVDVIARLSCANFRSVNDLDFINAYHSLSETRPNESHLNPLMGCAISLFPLLGRLAELVGRVRTRTERRNSPAIISEGIDLRLNIERWSLPSDLGDSTDDDSGDDDDDLSDSIQTAEAYRWASLLLLRQAVPEIPWKQSFWDMAQKVLVFLATIPISSRTTIIQIFPLMMAGCEAFEKDDKQWVLERWQVMSERMTTGLVDCCRLVTKEVWRRRDEYEARHGLHYVIRSTVGSSSMTDISGRESPTTGNLSDTSQDGASTRTRAKVKGRPSSSSFDFPVSAAFKKGIDPVTRKGAIDYTVRGSLHWLGVMKDWNWTVMLG